ncbi:hypothetical protein IE81DRAFT_123279 [Ceraceosorus guamensis]|uniref:Uncharacterized protein n=1 Tax=Ceraceosorus guamensis TaxID=1522189 RepID=A0A316VXQ8_9BASI|nr:hypothetical protein IE81DRAFT_123279 [Ceraceosorus guamensis]PWN42437.1 hypothetical protein IE81DRAFT_123279 [Ceraceosorus guamensis]
MYLLDSRLWADILTPHARRRQASRGRLSARQLVSVRDLDETGSDRRASPRPKLRKPRTHACTHNKRSDGGKPKMKVECRCCGQGTCLHKSCLILAGSHREAQIEKGETGEWRDEWHPLLSYHHRLQSRRSRERCISTSQGLCGTPHRPCTCRHPIKSTGLLVSTPSLDA